MLAVAKLDAYVGTKAEATAKSYEVSAQVGKDKSANTLKFAPVEYEYVSYICPGDYTVEDGQLYNGNKEQIATPGDIQNSVSAKQSGYGTATYTFVLVAYNESLKEWRNATLTGDQGLFVKMTSGTGEYFLEGSLSYNEFYYMEKYTCYMATDVSGSYIQQSENAISLTVTI